MRKTNCSISNVQVVVGLSLNLRTAKTTGIIQLNLEQKASEYFVSNIFFKMRMCCIGLHKVCNDQRNSVKLNFSQYHYHLSLLSLKVITDVFIIREIFLWKNIHRKSIHG